MVVNLQRFRRVRADEGGHIWTVGSYRKDRKAAIRYRVFFNGREVTNDTFYVDTRRGVVRMYLRDGTGRLFVDPVNGDEPAHVERRGSVKLIRRKAVAA